jgi:hypothetical protein
MSLASLASPLLGLTANPTELELPRAECLAFLTQHDGHSSTGGPRQAQLILLAAVQSLLA